MVSSMLYSGSYHVTSDIAEKKHKRRRVSEARQDRDKHKQRDSSEGRRSVVRPTTDVTPTARVL